MILGDEYVIEHYADTTWVRDPASPNGFVQPASILLAGDAGNCETFSIPETMEPGRYRVVKPYAAASNGNRRAAAEFEVSPN